MFAASPVEDDPALDPVPFEPPEGWPTAEVTPDDPAPVFDPETDVFPSDAYPAFPKRDGMLWVDALIDQRASLPQFRFAGRPHQLFLTGDQIYADSMSAAMLPVLNHVGRVLVGDEDLGSSPLDETTVAATLENFPPGFRRGAAVRSAAFSMGGGESRTCSRSASSSRTTCWRGRRRSGTTRSGRTSSGPRPTSSIPARSRCRRTGSSIGRSRTKWTRDPTLPNSRR